MTQIDSDYFYILCLFASMGVVSTVFLLFMIGDAVYEWYKALRVK